MTPAEHDAARRLVAASWWSRPIPVGAGDRVRGEGSGLLWVLESRSWVGLSFGHACALALLEVRGE